MTAAEITRLHDEAVFQRTASGQRALVLRDQGLSSVESRFLSVVTGFTPLRVLLDMDFNELEIPRAIAALCERGLIALAETFETPEVLRTA